MTIRCTHLHFVSKHICAYPYIRKSMHTCSIVAEHHTHTHTNTHTHRGAGGRVGTGGSLQPNLQDPGPPPRYVCMLACMHVCISVCMYVCNLTYKTRGHHPALDGGFLGFYLYRGETLAATLGGRAYVRPHCPDSFELDVPRTLCVPPPSLSLSLSLSLYI